MIITKRRKIYNGLIDIWRIMRLINIKLVKESKFKDWKVSMATLLNLEYKINQLKVTLKILISKILLNIVMTTIYNRTQIQCILHFKITNKLKWRWKLLIWSLILMIVFSLWILSEMILITKILIQNGNQIILVKFWVKDNQVDHQQKKKQLKSNIKNMNVKSYILNIQITLRIKNLLKNLMKSNNITLWSTIYN